MSIHKPGALEMLDGVARKILPSNDMQGRECCSKNDTSPLFRPKYALSTKYCLVSAIVDADVIMYLDMLCHNVPR